MKTIPYLLVGNHPKTSKLKERIIEIIRILKEHGNKIEASELEKALNISRIDEPSLFYKPLSSMKKWDLLQSHRTVEIDSNGKKHFKTTYELTPEFFYRYIEKTLIGMVRKELEMI